MLHNDLHQHCGTQYVPSSSVDVEAIETGTLYPGEWHDDTLLALRDLPINLTRPTMDAKIVRNNYVKYFMNEGAVLWQ